MYLNKLPDSQNEFMLHRFEGFPTEGVNLEDTSAPLTTAVVLDTETTGLDTSVDEIIEIAARLVHYDKSTRTICRIGPAFQALQQPSQPLTEDIQRITGLTDEMLADQSIDWGAFDKFCADASLFIAHNAGFDRPFVDRCSRVTPSHPWGCSWTQIPWSDWFPVAKQEVLTLYHGFFYTAHRALLDVDALVKLLSCPAFSDPATSYFDILLSNARMSYSMISANDAPFKTKDLLKDRGYRWDADARVWSVKVPLDQHNDEIAFLARKVYRNQLCLADAKTISPKDNFKS